MEESLLGEESGRLPFRSINSQQRVRIHMVNFSTRAVEVFWIDYRGNEVLYTSLLARQRYIIDSYVTHPWIFRDRLRHNLVPVQYFPVNKRDITRLSDHSYVRRRFSKPEFVCYPQQHSPNEFIHLLIMNGVYSLKQMCLHHFVDQQIETLPPDQVPKLIVNEFDTLKNGQQLQHIYGSYFPKS